MIPRKSLWKSYLGLAPRQRILLSLGVMAASAGGLVWTDWVSGRDEEKRRRDAQRLPRVEIVDRQ